jgi:hypothetical protein
MLDFGPMPSGTESSATFSLTLDENTPIGHFIDGSLKLQTVVNDDTLKYSFNLDFEVGLMIEDFESGNFNSLPWEFAGDANWIIDEDNAF